jgi:hypothetical protein
MEAMAASRASTSTPFGPRARARVIAAVGLAGLLGGMAVIVLSSGSDSGSTSSAVATTPAATRPARPKPTPRPAIVKLSVAGVGAYDPEGDRSENADQASLATDGNPTTAWKSEHYLTTFRKSGVGLVLDARRTVRAKKLVLTTDTPGYSAQIQAGSSATGPFTPVSPSKTTAARTVFTLAPKPARYLLVWVTSMPVGGIADVNEVAVTGRR